MAESKRAMRETAIRRLKDHINCPWWHYREMIKDIVGDDFDELTGNECVVRIIDLLTDDEPSHDINDTIGLPTDAFGNTMHFGDSVMIVTGPRRNQKSIVRALRDDGKVLCDDTWLDPTECAVDFKPKIEDILAELETIGFRNFGSYDAIVKQCAELAEELRELWEDRDE